MSWSVILSRSAVKDAQKLERSGLKTQAESILNLLREYPFKTSPSFEKLIGNLKGFYSRRINIKHRLIYSVDIEKKIVHVLRMWTYYQ